MAKMTREERTKMEELSRQLGKLDHESHMRRQRLESDHQEEVRRINRKFTDDARDLGKEFKSRLDGLMKEQATETHRLRKKQDDEQQIIQNERREVLSKVEEELNEAISIENSHQAAALRAEDEAVLKAKLPLTMELEARQGKDKDATPRDVPSLPPVPPPEVLK